MTRLPLPNRTGGGKGITIPWLPRYAESLIYSLNWVDQNVWREVVNSQPVALLCREKIVSTLASMEWRIEPKDPTERQELRLKIRHYTDLLQANKEQNTDFVDFVTHVVEDGLDLPFGSGVELIREGDRPSGRVVDYVLLDGATLYPTNNRDYPVVQRVPGYTDFVVFPRHAINRYNFGLRREIIWKGWAFPPPQKIYVAIQMISKGDNYYWKFLIDTPEVGLLDLMDMSKDTAESWIESFRSLMTGIDPYKIPVLYEHDKPVNYLPFNRSPQDIMFDKAISRYDALTAGGYGLSLSSIGFSSVSSGGETLAGSIRQERNDRSRGIGLSKRKFVMFVNRMLPPSLEFQWVDPDDEQQVARGRAKLSISTAANNWISSRIISPKEARGDLINSGLLTVTIPEEMPEEDKALFDEIAQGEVQARQNLLGTKVPASSGGTGEIRASKVERAFSDLVTEFIDHDDDGIYSIPMDTFVEIVLDEVEDAYNEYRKSLPLWSFARHKSLQHSKKVDVWEQTRPFLVNLQSDFLGYVEQALDNEEVLFDNIRESLVQKMIHDFAQIVGKAIKNTLEI